MKKIENISNKDCILTLPRNWNDENVVLPDNNGIYNTSQGKFKLHDKVFTADVGLFLTNEESIELLGKDLKTLLANNKNIRVLRAKFYFLEKVVDEK